MLRKLLTIVIPTGMILPLCSTPLGGQSPQPVGSPLATTRIESSEWQFERLVLNDGTEYSGLVQAFRENEIEFAQIFRKPGLPMSAIVRTIVPAEVQKLDRLPDDARRVLTERFERFKQRAHIEAGDMQDIALTRSVRDARKCWDYRGRWFTLISTADEDSTRRSIVRIDAPDPETLRALQRDVSGRASLKLADLLTADDQRFLATHAARSSRRHYLYAWGLAYYLTFEEGLLRDDRLERYLSPRDVSRIERFENLVDMPLDEFEGQWRTAILSM